LPFARGRALFETLRASVVGERAGRPWRDACALADGALTVCLHLGVNDVTCAHPLWQPRIGSSATPQPPGALLEVLAGPGVASTVHEARQDRSKKWRPIQRDALTHSTQRNYFTRQIHRPIPALRHMALPPRPRFRKG